MVFESVSAAVLDSGLKHRFIAKRIGVSEQVFSAMIAGRRKIGVDEFFELCQVLKKSPEELYYYNRTMDAV